MSDMVKDLSSSLRDQIDAFEPELEFREVGNVIEAGNGIAWNRCPTSSEYAFSRQHDHAFIASCDLLHVVRFEQWIFQETEDRLVGHRGPEEEMA